MNEGSTGRAAGLRRAIEEKLPAAPPLPPHLTTSLQLLDTRLTELKDWKSFSVAPKRVELMEEMESLVGATMDPVVLADRIKGLQEEWRTLSKGAGENVEADWQRFQEAAQKAYQPCREYFEAQSLVRQENLQRREALLQRLVAFESGHDWEQPDWRTVIVALRESKQQWRGHAPVDRAAGKAVQEQFVALTSNLQSRLDAEYAGNRKERHSLVERAQRLIAAEDSRKAIDEVKDLQLQWKEVGLVPRDEDQRLWEEFRQHCDAVFQKRQQEFAEHTRGSMPTRPRPVPPVRSSRRSPRFPARSCWRARGGFPICVSHSKTLVSCRGAMSAACARDSSVRWSVVKELSPDRKRATRSGVGPIFSMRRTGLERIARRSPGTWMRPSETP